MAIRTVQVGAVVVLSLAVAFSCSSEDSPPGGTAGTSGATAGGERPSGGAAGGAGRDGALGGQYTEVAGQAPIVAGADNGGAGSTADNGGAAPSDGGMSAGGSDAGGSGGDAGGSGEAGAGGEATNNAGPGPTEQCAFSKDANGFFQLSDGTRDHVVRLPVGYDVQAPTPQRLLVGLHGCGDTAFNHAAWATVPFAGRATQDYIALSVAGRDGVCWNLPGDSAFVFAAIARVRQCFYVHQKKIVVSGYSSGGELALSVGLKNASFFSGILVENANLQQTFGAANVTPVLTAASWKLNVALTARISDGSFLIAATRADRDKLLAAEFPLAYRELEGTHDGSSDDWSGFLLPKMANWVAP